MSKLTRSSSTDEITGLHREVNRFILFVLCATVLSIITIWITWIVWLNPTYPNYITFNGNVVNSIGMIVGFLPVGLPSAVTLVLVIVAVSNQINLNFFFQFLFFNRNICPLNKF